MHNVNKLQRLLILLLLIILATTAAVSAGADVGPFPDQRDSAEASVAWLLQEQQNEDGGFGVDFATQEPASSIPSTLDAVLALSAAGYSADTIYSGSSLSAVDYLKANAQDLEAFAATGGGAAGKVILALSAANKNPRAFAVHDYVAHLQRQYDGSTGSYNNTTAFNQALSILALTGAGTAPPAEAFTWLIDQQAADGSWDDGFGTAQNPDATAMAVMALKAGGRDNSDPAVAAALDFLSGSQLPTGGWEYGVGFGENANSTALVVQALAAAGENFYADDGAWAPNDISPLTALLAWQNGTGAFQADFGQGRFDDFFSTVQAIPASTGKPFPLPSRYAAAQAGLVCLAGLQDPAGGAWEQFAGAGLSAGGTARAVEAIAAAGANPQAALWAPGGTYAAEALQSGAADYLSGAKGGRAGIVTQGVVAAGAPYDPADFAGMDLPQLISSFLTEDGAYDDTAFGVSAHAEAMLGLLQAGEAVDPKAVDLLLDAQTDGDWGDADQNGIALNVLGRLDTAVPKALQNIKSTQQADGGWGFAPSPSNPSSSSEVVQGLVQQDENPFAPLWSVVSEGTMINAADMAMSQQQPNGCWPNFDATLDDPFSTTDAVILLSQLLVPEPHYSQTLPVVQSP